MRTRQGHPLVAFNVYSSLSILIAFLINLINNAVLLQGFNDTESYDTKMSHNNMLSSTKCKGRTDLGRCRKKYTDISCFKKKIRAEMIKVNNGLFQ